MKAQWRLKYGYSHIFRYAILPSSRLKEQDTVACFFKRTITETSKKKLEVYTQN